MRSSPFVLALTLAVSLALGSPAGAQTVAVPEFTVASPVFATDVAATYAGLYFLYTPEEYSDDVVMQRAFGPVWDPPQVLNAGGDAFAPVLSPVESGGFVAGWMQFTEGFSRLLGPLGAPDGLPSQITRSDRVGDGELRVAGLAAGTAIVWSEEDQQFGIRVLKARIAGRVYQLSEATPREWEVASTPSGGCVVTWRFNIAADIFLAAQVFDADGDATTPPLTLPFDVDEFVLSGVAASPVNGDMAIVGSRRVPSLDGVREIVVLRFDAGGAALGPEIVLGPVRISAGTPVGGSIAPDAAFDFAGNLYVAWSDHKTSTKGIYARAYDGNGVPFGPAVKLSSEPSPQSVKVARRPDGSFANAWIVGSTLMANVVSLCAPGSATCGDGVLNPACERCDDGPANDDTAADACRTDCLPAHCGDGTLDTGEMCDDGNFLSCDGCSPACTIETGVVCGDGIAAPACGEQCDDANAAVLDGCTPACRLERIAGGSGSKNDCFAEWSIDNPTNAIPYDKRGGITARQRCVDDDPRCDFDGGIPGSCTFHVRGCADGTDVAGCTPPTRLSSWLVVKPSEKQAATSPALADVRATLLGNVPASVVGVSERDVCSAELPIVVPLRSLASGGYKSGKLTIQTRATSYDGTLDKDKLALRCDPAS